MLLVRCKAAGLFFSGFDGAVARNWGCFVWLPRVFMASCIYLKRKGKNRNAVYTSPLPAACKYVRCFVLLEDPFNIKLTLSELYRCILAFLAFTLILSAMLPLAFFPILSVLFFSLSVRWLSSSCKYSPRRSSHSLASAPVSPILCPIIGSMEEADMTLFCVICLLGIKMCDNHIESKTKPF